MNTKLALASIALMTLTSAVGCGGPQKPAENPDGQTSDVVDHGDATDDDSDMTDDSGDTGAGGAAASDSDDATKGDEEPAEEEAAAE